MFTLKNAYDIIFLKGNTKERTNHNMNQILSTENKKNKNNSIHGPMEIRGIIRFFAVAILIFGIVLAGEGSFAIYKNVDDRKPANIPAVTIGRINDQAIVQVKHNVPISKITYYWDNGEKNVIPIGDNVAQEEITLLGYNSTLYLIVEDENGKQVSYQKQYLLDGVDITKPVIEAPVTQNGSDKMMITAKDETALSYLSYQWEGEEEVFIDAQTENQKEIKQEVTLTPGKKKITIKAEDMNGNVDILEKEILISTSKPKMTIRINGDKIIVGATDKDGVKDIIINLNGERFAARDVNQKKVEVGGPLVLKPGNNTISIEVTNISGYTEKATTEIPYP